MSGLSETVNRIDWLIKRLLGMGPQRFVVGGCVVGTRLIISVSNATEVCRILRNDLSNLLTPEWIGSRSFPLDDLIQTLERRFPTQFIECRPHDGDPDARRSLPYGSLESLG